jgi:membrane protein required for colicin V production
MNLFDLLILVTLLIATLIGAWRGFVREVISALTWILAFVLAWLFAGSVSTLFAGFLDEPVLRHVLAFVLIFVMIFVLGMVATWLIHKFIPPKRILRLANMALGGLVGVARGAVIVIILFLFAGLTSIPQQSWWVGAAFTPFFERAAVYVSSYIPSDIARHIRYG